MNTSPICHTSVMRKFLNTVALATCYSVLSLCAFVHAGDRSATDADAIAHIDALIHQDLQAHGTKPNGPVADNEFVRRIHLDLIGRIPTVEEVDAFMRDTRQDRRSRLIDDLLASTGHVSHMFNWLGDMLRVKDEQSGFAAVLLAALRKHFFTTRGRPRRRQRHDHATLKKNN